MSLYLTSSSLTRTAAACCLPLGCTSQRVLLGWKATAEITAAAFEKGRDHVASVTRSRFAAPGRCAADIVKALMESREFGPPGKYFTRHGAG